MFIKKISITNFQGFGDEVIIDLTPNNNQIEKDLNNNQFHKRTNGEIICPVVGIGGPNSSGKTTILNAIKIFFDYLDNNNNYKKTSKYSNEMLLFYLFYGEESEELNIRVGKEKAKELMEYLKEKRNIIKTNKNFKINSVYEELIDEIKKDKIYLELKKEWSRTKRFIKKETKITIIFGFSDKKEFIFTLKDDISDEGNVDLPKIKIEENNDFNNSEIDQIKDICKNYLICLFDEPTPIRLKYYNDIQYQLIKIAEFFGEKTLLEIIRIADKNIIEIIYAREPKGNIRNIINFENNDSSTTELDSLSKGTKKFITFFYKLLPIFKSNQKSFLILIDELEVNLHNSLSDFFKRLIMFKSKEMDIQLFFTSHNNVILTSYLTNKQIFLIEEMKNAKTIKKLSTLINNNNQPCKQLIEQKIGSHPSINDIDNLIGDLLIYEK